MRSVRRHTVGLLTSVSFLVNRAVSEVPKRPRGARLTCATKLRYTIDTKSNTYPKTGMSSIQSVPGIAERNMRGSVLLQQKNRLGSKRILAVLDRIGVCASTACAVHCILLPFIITALPFLGLSVLASSTFELAIIGFSVTLATLSFCWGSRLHGQRRTFLFVLSALMLFIFGHDVEGPLHWVVMAIGGCALAAGHLVNRRLCNTCTQCDDH